MLESVFQLGLKVTNNMAKDSITIEAPRTGVAQSPHVGFGNIKNMDIWSIPGVAKLNTILEKKSSTTVTAQITWAVRHPITPTEIYAIDTAGVVYKSSDTGATWATLGGNVFTVTIASPAVFSDTAHGLVENDTVVFSTTGALPTGLTAGTTYYVIAAGLTADAFQVSTSQGGSAVNTSGSQSGVHSMRITTSANGNGLAIWKNYLFVARNTKLDVVGDGTATGIAADKWTFNWKTIDSDTLWHPMITSKNDSKLYGGAGRYVYSLEELTTFAPGTGASYTYTQQALDLPSSYRIKCLAELGNNLMCGTWQGTNIYDIRIADIFPWDRSSVSFGQPIEIDDYGVHAMKNIGNSLIVLAGTQGTIFKCDGVNAYQIGQLPIDLSGGKYLEWYPSAICSYKNKVFFGVGNGGSTAIAGMGIYSLQQTGKGNILNLEHQNSQLTDGSSAPVKISALIPITRDTLLSAFRSDTTYGIDLSSATSYAYGTDYSASFETPLYQVGTLFNKKQTIEIEFCLAKELAIGEGIKFEYRVNLTDSFTAVKTPNGGTLTLTFATLGAITHHIVASDIPASEMLQMRISLLGTSTTSCELKYVIIR